MFLNGDEKENKPSFCTLSSKEIKISRKECSGQTAQTFDDVLNVADALGNFVQLNHEINWGNGRLELLVFGYAGQTQESIENLRDKKKKSLHARIERGKNMHGSKLNTR